MKGSTVATGLLLTLVLGLVSAMPDMPGQHHHLHGIVESLESCHGMKCGDHGSCHVDRHGDATCRCATGYSGVHCQTYDPCHDNPCGDHGICQGHDPVHPHEPSCTCDAGYSGNLCDYDPCHNNPCGSHGQCHVHQDASSPSCECDAGYSGTYCESHDPCSSHYCGDHGTCQLHHDAHHPTCHCHEGYYGRFCLLVSADLCNNQSCSGQGACHVIHVEHGHHIPTVSCMCNAGFSGDNCQIEEVSRAVCMQHGTSCYYGHCMHDLSSDEYSCLCGKDEVPAGHNCIPITDSSSTTIVPTTSTAQTTPFTTQTTPSTTQTTSSTTQATPLTTQATHTTTQITPSTTQALLKTTQTTPSQSSTTPTPIIATVPAIKYTCQKFNTVMHIGSHKPSENPNVTNRVSEYTCQKFNTVMDIGSHKPSANTNVTKYTCQKFNTVMDIGSHQPSANTNVTSCPSGSAATPEAFVIDHCNVTSPGTWTQGTHVMNQCQNIPLYTPVATFFNQRYSSIGGLSGILLGCLPSGFKLGVQECDKNPDILHLVSGGFLTMDPNFYYTVQ